MTRFRNFRKKLQIICKILRAGAFEYISFEDGFCRLYEYNPTSNIVFESLGKFLRAKIPAWYKQRLDNEKIDVDALLNWLLEQINQDKEDAVYLGQLYCSGTAAAYERVYDHIKEITNEAD